MSAVRRGRHRRTLGGTVENRGTTPKTYTLSVDLLDKTGTVLDTQTVTVGPVAPKSSKTFTIESTKGGAFGFRYKPLI